ncbi:MAG: MFS transporter [Planctomycetes bacterium]|nr:MFS transporter [Planctomycetota bacterium]
MNGDVDREGVARAPGESSGISTNARRRLERNLVAIAAFQSCAFGYALVPFLIFLTRSRGLTLADYASLQSVYYTTTLLTDVPTGLLADRIGRKPVLLLAAASQVAGFIAMAMARDFVAFAFGEVLLGLGQAMLSGTTAAFLYDSLRALSRISEYMKFEARSVVARLGGTSVAFLAGGIAAEYAGLEWAAWISALASFAAIAIACSLYEPPRAPARETRIFHLLKLSVLDVAREPDLRWVALLFMMFFVATRLAFHFYTPGLDRAGVNDFIVIGAIYFLLNVVAALSTRFAPRLHAAAGERVLLILLLFVLSLTFGLHAMSGAPAVAIGCFFIQQIPFGVHFPVIASFVNSRAPSERRATVLSCLSLTGRAAFALCFPFIGAIAEHNFSLAMWIAAAFFFVVCLVLAFWNAQTRLRRWTKH